MLLIFLCLVSLASFARSAPAATTTSLVADSQCTNGPLTRQCWANGLSLSTDYDTTWPNTGKTVEYNLEVTNTTLSPDGTPRMMMVVNGQYPGPTLYANWGDTLKITVTNSMQNNGTSIHWHGMRQYQSCNMDGVNGVTECPLAPGQSKTYSFVCTEYGTTWYHSHFSAQYGDGVLGAIVVNGPASSNYDIDLGPMPITDWYYKSAWIEAIAAANGGPPTADNGLINGTMVSPTGTGGAYNTVTMTKGKKYRLRLINTSLDNHFKVHLDGHNFTVIQADFVPIVPYTADWIFIGIGQRYDVIINANQPIGNYWFRAEVQRACGSNANNLNIKSIFTYAGAPSGNPNTTETTDTPSCNDETQLVPFLKKDVPSSDFIAQSQLLEVAGTPVPGSPFQWTINGSMINVDWEVPTLKYVQEGNNSFPSDLNLLQAPNANEYYYWIIQEIGGINVPHPIHLHGHDFFLLGTGTGTWSSALATTLTYTNPTRRDVAMLPANGWMVIAFYTDNPGAWLLHCHIAWHVGEGLAVQFLERESEIASTMDLSVLDQSCSSWDAFQPTMYYAKDDSGL